MLIIPCLIALFATIITIICVKENKNLRYQNEALKYSNEVMYKELGRRVDKEMFVKITNGNRSKNT